MKRVFIMFLTLAIPFIVHGGTNFQNAYTEDASYTNEFREYSACRGCAPSRPVSVTEASQIIQQIVAGGMLANPTLSATILAQILSHPTNIDIITQVIVANGGAGITDYAYIYNANLGEFVAAGESIPFDSDGLITAGFTHPAGSTDLTVLKTGVYKFDFFVRAFSVGSAISLYVNDMLIPGSSFITSGANVPNPGQVIVSLKAGDIITLKNDTSVTMVLETGTQVNAFISAIKLK